MKVMLFCPTYRIEPETLDSLFRLDVGEHYVHMVFTRGNHWTKEGRVNRLMNYLDGQKLFLAHDYDAMFIVESDMVVPPDALHKLITLDADIGLGLYMHRHGTPTFNAQRFRHDEPHKQGIFYHQHEAAQIWGDPDLRVSAGGFGCALIKRAVLTDLRFRLDWIASPDKRGLYIPADCDTYFMVDALRKEYDIRMDATIVCGHKKPEGDVLWPAPDGMTIEARDPSPYPVF